MGTRADFYIKKGNQIEWLGSTAFDGYGVAEQTDEDNFSPNDKKSRTNDWLEYLLHHVKDEKEFKSLMIEYLNQRRDGTLPENGWPWPWDNSKLTDECYVFDTELNTLLRMKDNDRDYDNNKTACLFAPVSETFWDDEGELVSSENELSFFVPDMSEIKNIASGKRSGLLTISISPSGRTIVDG